MTPGLPLQHGLPPLLSEDDPKISIEVAAAYLERAPGTVRNLLSKHQLPLQKVWIVRGRKRHRQQRMTLRTLKRLRELTLGAPYVRRYRHTES